MENTVVWTTGLSVADLNLAPEQGTHAGTAQTSVLTLSPAQLAKLKAAGGKNPEHKFTCKIVASTAKTDVTAVQTINIYTPGIYLYKRIV